jgi:hypothetical protein
VSFNKEITELIKTKSAKWQFSTRHSDAVKAIPPAIMTHHHMGEQQIADRFSLSFDAATKHRRRSE